MPVFCCFRSRSASLPDNIPETSPSELPARPPRAKLSKICCGEEEAEIYPVPSGIRRTASMLATPIQNATVHLTDFDIEDSDGENELPNTKNSSTSTLEAFKSRVIGRLSHRTESRRQPQVVAGNSEEEIARRAELKRLMHKRIQEELQIESEEEDNCQRIKSNSSVTTSLPGGGPRDTIEFSVSDVKSDRSSVALSPPDSIPLGLPVIEEGISALRRRSSLPASIARSRERAATNPDDPDRGSLAHMPSSPQLIPVHLPSIRGSESMRSWRLSYSTGQIIGGLTTGAQVEESSHQLLETVPKEKKEDCNPQPSAVNPSQVDKSSESIEDVRQGKENTFLTENEDAANEYKTLPSLTECDTSKLSREGNTSVYRDSRTFRDSVVDRYSSLDVWVRLQRNSQCSAIFTNDTTLEISPGDASEVADGIKGDETSGIVTSSQPSRRHGERHLQRVPGVFPSHDGSTDTDTHLPGSGQVFKEKAATSLEVKAKSGDHSREYPSSRYTSLPDTSPPTPPGHISNLSKILSRKKRSSISPSPPVNGLANSSRMTLTERSDVSSYKTAPIQSPTPPAIVIFNAEKTTNDDISPVSKTSSFELMEAELQSVAKRFDGSKTRLDPSNPVASKFREEFDDAGHTKVNGKPSILARLHLPLLKKGKHVEKTQGPTQHRMYIADGPDATSGSMDKTTTLSESASDLWQRAVKLESDRREALRRNKQKASKSYESSSYSNSDLYLATPTKICPKTPFHTEENSIRNGVPQQSGLHSPKSISGPGPFCCTTDDVKNSLEASNRILKEWQHQIVSEESGAGQMPSFTTQIFSAKKSRAIPASWAKWPSHTREERTASASQKDRVTPKDFAVKVSTPGGSTRWVTDTDDLDASATKIEPLPRSFSSRFSKAIKGSISKMIAGKDPVDNDMRNLTAEHRKSHPSDCYLEYPELEILPRHGGYKELKALEQEIETIRRASVSSDIKQRRASGSATKPPLSLRIAQEVHRIEHGCDEVNTPDVSDFFNTPPPKTPTKTPTKQRSTPQDSSAKASDMFETPVSRISYDDWVVKRILDENGSVKSDTTATVKRSKSNMELMMPGSESKYSTCNGRINNNNRNQTSMLLQSTQEFGAELERMKAVEREKALKKLEMGD